MVLIVFSHPNSNEISPMTEIKILLNLFSCPVLLHKTTILPGHNFLVVHEMSFDKIERRVPPKVTPRWGGGTRPGWFGRHIMSLNEI
jgi:hypothetical protein